MSVPLKKEIVPFLSIVRDAGLIYRFVIKKKTIEIYLKKIKSRFKCNPEKLFRSSEVEAILYRDPTSVIVVSTPRGVFAQGLIKPRVFCGGPVLLITN